MEDTSKKKYKKRKVNEVNTFSVPIPLGEIKKNITITTNTPSKPSKDQIINQAFKLHSQGNISEAAKYYQHLINQGFKDHRIFSNYGGIFLSLGQLKEAEFYTRKSIEIKPDFSDSYLNLGSILRDLGKLKEAELSTRKAIILKNNDADAYYNLGNLLSDLGQSKEAELSYRKAIELKPDYAEAHSNLGNILSGLGNLQGAFDSYLRAIDINPTNSYNYILITSFLKDSDPSQLNKSKLKYTINLLLEKNNICHKELIRAFNFLYGNVIISSLEEIDADLLKIALIANNKVIINALKKIILCDPEVEKILTKVRRNLCHHIARNIETTNNPELQFIIALGEQCFFNEYIYSFTEEEKESLNIIIKRCKDNKANETNISILSCYYPLYELLPQIPILKSFNSSNQSFKELLKLQISEPLKEKELSKKIKKIGSINNQISKKVKTFYEENPYPRWRFGSNFGCQNLSINQAINNEIKPNSISQNIDSHQLKVLIAGCGTGNQILQAQRYRNAEITAIDLSLSSLAYAQRKIIELGIDNVKLIQADILEVNLLKEQFDIIECGGVLVCVQYPLKGLQALLGTLKNGGFMKLGLYSELARQDVVQARKYLERNSIKFNMKDMRVFRDKVISEDFPELIPLTNTTDFYTTSMCRDLCFHIQENRFTISQIETILISNNLKFLGFLLPQPIKSLYKKYFPEDKAQTNLENWAKFEEKHPNTFRLMYQFWVCKMTS